MEVHYHPNLEHKHKAWKEYLLEGLMIFIAVMMGFIAESIREGITNREHVKELVTQLEQDLRADTAQLNDIYAGDLKILHANDTLVELLQDPQAENDAGRLQHLIVNSHSMWPFYPSTGAIAAIKNEIHLEQFSNSKMIGLIAQYEKHVELLHTIQEITLQYQRTYLDPFLMKHFSTASLKLAFDSAKVDQSLQPKEVTLQNISPGDLSQLGSAMVLIAINTGELKDNNRKLVADAEAMLAYVKEEYGH